MTMVSIYGVDIKERPDGQLKCIEINGVNFGTDFFKDPAWHGYYFRFMDVLGHVVGGKKIFIETDDDSLELTPDDIACAAANINKKYDALLKQAQALNDELHPFFRFDYDWLHDLKEFNLNTLSKPSEDESAYYVQAGRRQGLQAIPFTNLRVQGNVFVFTGTDGMRYRVDRDEIGCIWAKEGTLLRHALKTPQHLDLFVNSPYSEAITDSKVFFYESRSKALQDQIAWGVPYGLGVRDPRDVLKLLDHYQVIVRKRGGSYCGTGVDVVPSASIRHEFEADYHPSSAEIRASAVRILRAAQSAPLEELVSMYQPFCVSKPIKCEATKGYHDGCARGIVIKPTYGDPIWVGGQWRLSQQPIVSMDEVDGTIRVNVRYEAPEGHTGLPDHLNHVFRANLSRGAIPQPLTPEEDAHIGAFAVSLVANYHDMLEATSRSISEYLNISSQNLRFILGAFSKSTLRDLYFMETVRRLLPPGELSAVYKEVARNQAIDDDPLQRLGRELHFL